MENNTVRSSPVDDEQVIDLKELILYVCRKWRVLILVGLIGVLVGIGVGLYKMEPHIEDFDLEDLHLNEIEQFARYKELYEEQVAWEKESVYLNMDPHNAYTGNIRYYLRLKESNNSVVSQLYSSILNNNEIYERLIEASGLDCTIRAIQQLIWISYSTLNQQEQLLMYGDHVLTVQVTIGATAPSAEACQAMLDLLDREVQEMNQYVEETYGAVCKERLTDPCEKSSYHSGIAGAKKDSTATLGAYNEQITTIGELMTDDDKTYYSLVYDDDEEDGIRLTWLKWGIIIGVLFGAMGVFVYAVIYLLDGHIKNVDELMVYGLHPFALIEGSTGKKKLNALDKLFTPRPRYQSDAYLAEALCTLEAEQIILCGDLSDPDVAAHAKQVGEGNARLSVEQQMVESADTQMKAKQADGVVLLVHLWKTKRADLEQEIRICQKIGARILGVAVIG